MRRIIFIGWVCLLATTSLLQAQRAVPEKAKALFSGKDITPYELFSVNAEPKTSYDQWVREAIHLILDDDVLMSILRERPNLLRLRLPGRLDVTLDLYRAEVFADNTTIRTSDGRVSAPNPANLFYRGMISGNDNSLAIVSIFESHVQILYADDAGNKRVQRTPEGGYIAIRDADLIVTTDPPGCFTTDPDAEDIHDTEDEDTAGRAMTGNCIQVFAVADYKSYQDNGSSVANTEAWLAELWNEVITLYENDDIPVGVSDVLIYTSTDPYASLTTTSAILNAFRTYIANTSYSGRLAHFLSTRGLGGGVAFLNVLCSNTHQVAVSTSLSTNIVQVPIYSWSVEVVTHEMGHNVGSPHTHACSWNGNNTAYDICGPTAGYSEGCTQGPLPASGTIMSYCHLVSGIGINFNNGFGDQPGNLVRSKYNNANCNTGICAPPPCTALQQPVPGSTNVEVWQTFQWDPAPTSSGYKLTVGTSPTNGNILNNVDVGQVTYYTMTTPLPFNTTIYVKIVPYSAAGEATGCQNQTFTTEANVPPSCTALAFPADGATEVDLNPVLTWPHSAGNQLGYKISIGTTLNGTQIANQVNVGNVNSYDHPEAFPANTILYVKITPYGTGGDITGCASQSFTTTSNIYCPSYSNISSDEWISMVTIGTFTKNSGASTYSNFTQDTIVVSRGGTYTIQLKPTFSGATYPEYFRVWADFNQDGDFADSGEQIFSSGPHGNTVTGTITIPITAFTGTTRLRVSMRYNGFPSYCQLFDYGEVEDYTLKVKCDLVTTTSETGNGSLRNVSLCVGNGGEVRFAPSLNNQTIAVSGGQIVCNGNWKWMAEPGSNITIAATGSTGRILSIPAGTSMEIQNLKLVGGQSTMGSAIENVGTLKLRDSDVHRKPGSDNPPLRNVGMLEILGNCDVRF